MKTPRFFVKRIFPAYMYARVSCPRLRFGRRTCTHCQVKSIHKQQTTIRKPIECAPEASSGGREWAEMTEGFHLEATRHRVLTYVPSEEK